MGARVLRRLQYPAPLLVITICFFWKLTLSRQYTWLDQPDIVYQVMPWLQFQASEWHSGRFPLWDPHLLAGQPLAGQVQTGTLNPLNWLLFAVPLKDGFIRRGALHWYFVLIHYLGALLFYWLCRDLKLSPVSSLLAGCAFGMGGFLGITVWPQLLFSAVWMPLVLMLFLRVMRDERPLANAAWCGAVMGLSLLGTHHNVPLFFGVALGGLWIASSRRLLPAALFVVCFLLVASPQILTARELGELSLRWVSAPEPVAWGQKVPYSVHQEYSNGPASVLGIVIPGFFRHTDPFLGLVVVSLAAMAGWKKKTVRLFLALAAWGLFCSLGSAFFLHGVLYSVLPYLNMARNPSMAIAVFHLGAIGLAAFGLDACRAAPESCRKLVWPLAVLSAVLYAGLALRGQEYYHLAMPALAALVLACVYAVWSRSAIGNGWASGLLILLMLVELGNVSTAGYQPLAKPLFMDKLYQNQDIARFLRTRGEPVRVSVDSEDIPYNFGDWFGVDEAGGNQPGALRAIITALPDPAMQRLLSVNYRIGHAPSGNFQTEVFTGASGLKVYRDDGAQPRVRADRVLGQTISSNQVSADVEMDSPGTVLVSDAWFPGWKAEVDGQPVPIERAHGMIRGVAVGQGRHHLGMRYVPVTLYAGAGLALLGLLICGAMSYAGWSGRRDLNSGPPGPEPGALPG